MKGIFITFEGPDGSGKSTQVELLVNYLRLRGYDVVHTREPGGTSLAEFLRDVLLKVDANISPTTELLLYAASRAQHTSELIRPALKLGKIVLCERYTDATVAYQGYGRKINLKLVHQLNKIATDGLTPDLTILLDLPVEKGLKRIKKGRIKDRFEREELSFHRRVRSGYLSIAKLEPKRIKVISSLGSIENTHKKIIKIVAETFRFSFV
ncbi:MAG: dTMP kinase [Elusimicrobiota bacterium]|nr:dTMP kinase [Elusimicrobiota bacterium]